MGFIELTCEGGPIYISIDSIIVVESDKGSGSVVAVTPYFPKYYHVDEEPKEVIRRIYWVKGLIKKANR